MITLNIGMFLIVLSLAFIAGFFAARKHDHRSKARGGDKQ